jgi:hypothetical protein
MSDELDDLVRRLKTKRPHGPGNMIVGMLLPEAADAITSLRADLAAAEADRAGWIAREATCSADAVAARKAAAENYARAEQAEAERDAARAERMTVQEAAKVLVKAGIALEDALRGDSLGDVDGARDEFAAALDAFKAKPQGVIPDTAKFSNAVMQAAKDAREVFVGHKRAKEAVDYMEQLLLAALRALAKGDAQ